MFIKNISKQTQLVTTINGKEEIKDWGIFEVCKSKGEEILRNYKTLFIEVEKKETEKTEVKTESKKTLKSTKK